MSPTPAPASTPAPTVRWGRHRRGRRRAQSGGHSLSGDSAIGFSGMEMETLVRYNFPVQNRGAEQCGIGPGMPEIPANPMFDMKPNALIYGARYDRMMEAFGGKGFFVEDPKDIRGALDEAMNHRGPALVNVVISQGAARKPQAFRWHS